MVASFQIALHREEWAEEGIGYLEERAAEVVGSFPRLLGSVERKPCFHCLTPLFIAQARVRQDSAHFVLYFDASNDPDRLTPVRSRALIAGTQTGGRMSEKADEDVE